MTVIGVVSGLGPDGFLMSHRNYIDAIVAVGGSPIMIPAMVDPDDALKLTERIDALLLLSGGDIHPRRYGDTVRATLHGVDEQRDGVELAIAQAAMRRGIKAFGVCRGAQLLAVAHGGRLAQDLLALGMNKHMVDTIDGEYASIIHPIEIKEGTLASSIFPNLTKVNSQHHQCISDTGSLLATAWSPDGVVEAVEGENCFGVQWHPELIYTENSEHLKPFEWLVRK
ncbi:MULTISPECIES: gamma-glutamyl-gamma-aminobutyrate hydrolase family protein [unclassified Mycolicibacterium]|jgi:putative glutamine amidotransferase|uniref:gamma-glutamyl-gamma-aminobutyrate hydrolase family protein n=1 Tax=unclassified Mycolicibacterium TaxID=2636767 RepID=UPI001F4C2362|nr:gamma-glutamyl-gamma-aminobutyrate hydrolase family protein [Mycolicibacterium sp. YH-1]UNB51554.1 gamma-glutamyl-gamma-aminobutyrate hydrolase family protein [Mycolicibacterium sp. YH-1]HET7741887.1 gamma-glutamyl-gamma-aminobutyrate hydrolase family protein [Mycobacterium sp.]